MLPENGDDLQQAFTLARQPGLTFGLYFQAGRVTGTIDGLEAVRQAVLLALQTERFFYEIFTPAYGNELHALVGTAPPLSYAQLRQAVTEALSVDDRIEGISGFAFSRQGDRVKMSFTVATIYGDLEEEMEVAL